MKRYLFHRDIFKSRLLSGGHAILFACMLARSIALSRESWIIAGLSLLLTFWTAVTGYNAIARHREFVQRWKLAFGKKIGDQPETFVPEIKDPGWESVVVPDEMNLMLSKEDLEPRVELQPEQAEVVFCFDCATENLQIPAPFKVARGPEGQQVPVCLLHAKEQAQKNGEPKE